MRINVPFVSILALVVGASFVSCASTPSDTSEKSDTKSNEIIIEEPKVQNFVDWQFKGFGKDIPESAESVFSWVSPDSAVNNGIIAIENNQLITFGKGTNPDQAINVLEDSFETNLAAYEENHEIKELSLTEDYWLKVNQDVWETDKPYMAIRIYEIN